MPAINPAYFVYLTIGSVLFLVAAAIFDFDTEDELGAGAFSVRSVLLFAAGFGLAGYLTSTNGFSTLAILGSGAATGLGFAAMGLFLLRILYSNQTKSQLDAKDFVGKTAMVETSIPENGIGRIRVEAGHSMELLMARSRSGAPVPANQIVKITEVVASVAIVEQT